MAELNSQTCFHHFVSSRGQLISFHKQVPDGERRSEVFFSRRVFERESGLFLSEANGVAVITRSKGSRFEILTCKCVLHSKIRLIVPCVLVVNNAKKSDGFQYILLCLSDSNQLESCLKFMLPYRVKGDMFIFEGPTVLWTHAGHVWCASSQAGGVKQMPIHMSHTVVGELPLDKGSFVLGLQSVLESDQEVTSQTCGYFIQDECMFDGNLVLPHPYISITCCLLVFSAVKAGDVLKTSSVVATSNRQLLSVENGVVKDVCQLPFTQPEGINLVNTGRNGSLFVIFFNDRHVCAVWKDTFTIASEWSGVSSVLVDDFLGIGTDQILLIFKESDPTSQPVFIITDLCGVSYSNIQAEELMKPPCVQSDKYFFTIQALESQLQSGFTVLQELQREEKAKDGVIQQSLRSLIDNVSKQKPVLTPHEQESLVALWDCDETSDENEDDKMQDLLTVSSNHQVDKLWHRITGDRLVVGVILTTDRSEPVSSVSLFLLTETGQGSAPTAFQTQSQVFWLPTLSHSAPSPMSPSASSYAPSSSSCDEPAAKRSRQQRSAETSHDLNTGRLAVTALAALTPLLNSGRVKCHVMLHYAPTQDVFAPASNSTPTPLYCGQVVLDLHDILQMQLLSRPELKTDESLEDFLSLMAVLDHWTFLIDSPDYSLGDIVGRIQNRVSCKRIEVSSEHLLINSAGPSAPMLLRWHQITPFQAELSVHSSELQMLQFLDLLLAYLPGSCTVELVKATTGQSEAQIFSLALEREITSLRDCVSAMLSKEKDDDNKRISSFITPDPRHSEALQRCRDDWQREVERSKRNLCPLVDVQRYRVSTESFFKEQLRGDLALLNVQKTLYS